MAYNYYSEIDDNLKKQAELALYDIDLQEKAAMAKIAQRRAESLETLYTGRSGAYAEYAKAINPYGYNTESLYASGIGNSGKSETAKAGYFNAYTGLLSDLQKNYSAENASISSDERDILSDYDSERNKARAQAYNNMLEEYVRRYSAEIAAEKFEYQKAQDERDYQYKLSKDEYQKQKDERDYQYKLAQASKSSSKSSSSSSSSSKASAKIENDESLSDAEVYAKLTDIFYRLDQSTLAGEDNPNVRIAKSKQAYLDVYEDRLTPGQYKALKGMI